MSSASQTSRPRKNQGRRKSNNAKMKNESNLQVTFSERHLGLFKKANELCALTGAEVGLVVFSPDNKAYSFGHLSFNTIAERFLAQNPPPVNVSNRSIHVQQTSTQFEKEDVEYLDRIEKHIEVENEKWIPSVAAIGELNYEQLKVLKGKIMEFGKNLEAKMELKSSEMQDDVVLGSGTYAKSGGSFSFVANHGQRFD